MGKLHYETRFNKPTYFCIWLILVQPSPLGLSGERPRHILHPHTNTNTHQANEITQFLSHQYAPSTATVTMILILCFIGFLLIVLRTVQIAWFSPLSAFPNAHFLAPLTPLWILWIKYTKRENRLRNALHEKLGPVVRVGPRELSICGTEGVKAVYRGGFDKTGFYGVFMNFGWVLSIF